MNLCLKSFPNSGVLFFYQELFGLNQGFKPVKTVFFFINRFYWKMCMNENKNGTTITNFIERKRNS
jgi:hypothetical protein